MLDEHECVLYNTNHKEHKSVLKLKWKGEMNMENTMKMYITADEVAELLGVSRGYLFPVFVLPPTERVAATFPAQLSALFQE